MNDEYRNENSIFKGESFFPIWCHRHKSAQIENKDSVTYDLKHEFLEIRYIFEGGVTYKIEDNSFVVKNGDIVFINTFEYHSTTKIDEEGCRYHLIMISLDFFSEIGFNMLDLRKIFETDKIKIANVIRYNQKIVDIFKSIIEEYFDCKQGFQIRVAALAAELFVILLRNYTKIEKNLSRDLRHEKLVQNAIVEISNHFAEKHTLEDLAKLCNMSKFHFCRIFKQETGMTAMQYLMHHRIKNAEIMLIHTNYKISEVAQNCGIDDVAHFSKVFKKYCKLSPQQFRTLHAKREDIE